MSRSRVLGVVTAALAIVALVWSCKGVPTVAPTGAVVSMFANPLDISAGGSSQLTVSVFEVSGQPVPNGTVVNLTTTLGTVTPSRLEVVGGFGQAVLTVGSELGDATVTASSGAASSATVLVIVGGVGSTVTLVASPTSLPAGGGATNLTATLIGALGEPLVDKRVVFETSSGSLASGGGPVTTDATGRATDTLVTTVDATASLTVLGTGESATVEIDVAGTGIASLDLTADPETIGPLALGQTALVNLAALALNADGIPVNGASLVFSTDAGSLGTSGVVRTNSSGLAPNTLTTDRASTVTVSGGGLTGTAVIMLTRPAFGMFLELDMSPTLIVGATPPIDDPACPTAVNNIDVTLIATVTLDGIPVKDIPVNFFVNDLYTDTPAPGAFCETNPQAVSDADGLAKVHYQLTGPELLACSSIRTPCEPVATNVCPPATTGKTAINRCCCAVEFGAIAVGRTVRSEYRIFADVELPNRPLCGCSY